VFSIGCYRFIVDQPITRAGLDTEMDAQLGSVHGSRTAPA
jgi:hypothetical protein